MKNIIDRIIRKCELLEYNIAIIDGTRESVLQGKPFKYKLLTHNSENWFADPFVLEVTEHTIILLAEEFDFNNWKGKISKLTIDRKTFQLLSSKPVLVKTTHLSYPAIRRINGNIYVYPENGASGRLVCYKYNKEKELLTEGKLILEGSFADATITDLFGDEYMFLTNLSECSGSRINIYKKSQEGQWEHFQTKEFDENIARMAGDFFQYNGAVYRPAQDCNKHYGHGTVIQKVELKDGKFVFSDIIRYYSPDKRMSHGIHTLNSYMDVTVVDMEGYKWPMLAKIAKLLRVFA